MGRQRYVSDELTHFVGQNAANDDARFELLVSILSAPQWLTHWPHEHTLLKSKVRIRRDVLLSSNELVDPDVICFCDIPVADFAVHMEKYSKFGLAFSKSFLTEQGATPVFYVAAKSAWFSAEQSREATLDVMNRCGLSRAGLTPLEGNEPVRRKGEYFDSAFKSYRQLILDLSGEDSPLCVDQRKILDQLDEFLTSGVFSFLKFFDHEEDDDDPENWYMEREWRMHGNLKFQLSDVRRVILPERFAGELRRRVPAYTGQVTFAG